MLTATLRLFSEESGSSDYSPKTAETIAAKTRLGKYNGGISYKPRAKSYKARGRALPDLAQRAQTYNLWFLSDLCALCGDNAFDPEF